MRTRSIAILLAGLTMAAAATSCSKDEWGNYKGIRFRAQSVGYFGNPKTKTTYTGESSGNMERINWDEGDLITVYCANAYMLNDPDVNFTDYAVKSSKSKDGAPYICTATITPVEDANALQWGTGEHTFYAMYPSPNTASLEGAGVTFEEGEMTFPILAAPIMTQRGEDLFFVPRMDYAPMLAKNTVAGNSGSVNLAFAPQYTAFEFTVSKGSFESIHITSFTLMSMDDDEPVAGIITVPAGKYSDADEVLVADGSTSTSIGIDWSSDPVVMDDEHPNLTITVFALPQTLAHLKIQYTGTEIGTRSLALKNASEVFLEFPAYKKYRIFGLSFPVILPVDNPEAISWAYTVQVMENYAWWMDTAVEPQDWVNWVNTSVDNSGDFGTDIIDGLSWWLGTYLDDVEPVGWEDLPTSIEADVLAQIQDSYSWWMGANLPDDITFTDSPLDHVTLSETTPVYLWPGQTVKRTADAIAHEGYTSPAATIKWTAVTQPESGVVDVKISNGEVTALGAGVATIYATATSYDGTRSCSACYTVYVNNITGISLSAADASVAPGGTTTVTATITHTANGADITEFPSNLITWDSATTAAITLSDAALLPETADASAHTITATVTATGVAAGTSTITASSNPIYYYGISASLAYFPCQE